ncbi:MAG: phage major capsid protein [Clostridia bacterium]|nr:phage major capsid protein [Clostridia bacterium]
MNNTKTYNDYLARLDALKEEMLGIKRDSTEEGRKIEAEYAVAFKDMLHTGMPQKALRRGSAGSGNFIVPDTFEQKLVKGLTEKSLIRKLGTVMKTNTKMRIPTIIADGEAAWIPENEPVQFSEAVYGEIVLDAYKLAHKVVVSDEMLEDANFDVEDYIRQLFVESVSAAEELALFIGDGNGKPTGLLHQTSVGWVSEKAGDITYDDILNLIHSVKSPYRKNAVLVMSEDAITKLLSIIHYHGNSPWDVSLKDGTSKTLFGYPVYTTNYLDRVLPGTKPVLFGDFSYFWIGERGKRSVKRLVERYADQGQVAYITSERIDAKLVLPEAVKSLEVKA